MSADLAWKFWAFVAVICCTNLATLWIGFCMGRNKGDEPVREQGDPHENPQSWGQP